MAPRTAPQPPPAPTITSDPQGNREYAWSDGVRILCALAQRDRSNRYEVTVYVHRTLITTAQVNLLSLPERGQLLAHCEAAHTDATWLTRLVLLSDDLRTGQALPPAPEISAMAEVQAAPVQWLWWPYVALGKLALLDGDPGIGKSLLTLQMAAALSRGWTLPDQQGRVTPGTGAPQTTLLLCSEDGLADTMRPRLDAAGAACEHVFVLSGWRDAHDTLHPFSLTDLPVLEAACARHRPTLVCLDPVQAFFPARLDMHRANETRPLLAALARVAETYACAILCVRHPAKPGQGNGKALHRGLGSIDLIATARTGLLLEQHPSEPTLALMAQHKSNLGPLGRTQRFSKKDGVFTWAGVSRIDAETLWGSNRGPEPVAFLDAFFWLEKALDGNLAWSAKDLAQRAEEEGINKRTLYRAKKALGVVSTQGPGGWTWRLPPLPLIHLPTTLSGHTGLTGVTGLTCQSDAVSEDAGGFSPDGLCGAVRPETPERPDCQVVYRDVSEPQPPVQHPSRCAAGGQHIWLARGDLPRLCARCDAVEAEQAP